MAIIIILSLVQVFIMVYFAFSYGIMPPPPSGYVQVQVGCTLHWGVCRQQEAWAGNVLLPRWIQLRWSVYVITLKLNSPTSICISSLIFPSLSTFPSQASGQMTPALALVHIPTPMETLTRVSGATTLGMAKVPTPSLLPEQR